MSWILIAILAYFLNSVVLITDKFLVSKEVSSPVTYAFYVGVLSVFVVCFIPFTNFFIPSGRILVTSLLSGVAFLFALVFFFTALFKDETSRVITVVFGSLIPIFALLLSAVFLQEALSFQQLFAFVLLVSGSVLICCNKGRLHIKTKNLSFAFLSAFLFSVSHILIKIVYLEQPFLNSFIWSRIGSFMAAFLLLIPIANRKKIFSTGRRRDKTNFLLVGNKVLAGLYFVLLNWSISQGSVSMINALQGIQYVFVFVIVFLFSRAFPNILKEELDKMIIWQKISAIFLISLGLIVLSI